jgi:hypothetical protein
MKQRDRHRGLTALDLLEEAVHLLRKSPITVHSWYVLGAVPFILVLLYFWTDMSWSADARADCATAAMLVAVAFVWMKFCQAMFARCLAGQLKLDSGPPITFGGRVRMFLQQAIIQPSKLFVIPVASIITLPFAWVFAFYESVTAFGESNNLRALWSRSWKQAKLWPRQNHNLLGIYVLLGSVMFLNVLLLVLVAPWLVKIFSGFENVFTKSGVHVLNSTVLAVIACITYLCCDPLLKAVYVLRCFYGEALQSGEDLQVELRRLRVPAAVMLAALVMLLGTGSLVATETAIPPPSNRVTELERSIGETISKPEFSWRTPRSEALDSKEKPPNAIERFLRQTGRVIAKWWRAIIDWIERMSPKPSGSPSSAFRGAGGLSRSVLEIGLIVLCIVLLVFLVMKIRERIGQSRRVPVSKPAARPVNIAEESVTADQLPEDEWLRLATELIEKREWRLALRALFLDGLAHLSDRGVIALARHKSNREYQTELKRRAPAQTSVQEAFARNLREVERAWYGRHQVDSDALQAFRANLETIRAV